MTVQTQPQATRDLRQAARQGLLPAGAAAGWPDSAICSPKSWANGSAPALDMAAFDLADHHRWIRRLNVVRLTGARSHDACVKTDCRCDICRAPA